jgi:hypothetical protein
LQDFVNFVKFLILHNLMKKITGKMLTQLRHYSGAHGRPRGTPAELYIYRVWMEAVELITARRGMKQSFAKRRASRNTSARRLIAPLQTDVTVWPSYPRAPPDKQPEIYDWNACPWKHSLVRRSLRVKWQPTCDVAGW